VDWEDDEHDQYLWSHIKDIFKKEYAVQTNERLILEGLSKPGHETDRNNEWAPDKDHLVHLDHLGNQGKLQRLGGLTLDPPYDCNGGISNLAFGTFKRQYTTMMYNFFKMNLFKAALTPELRSVVTQQDQETNTVKKMYQVATTEQREGNGKPPAFVNKIREEETSADLEDDNEVAAFCHWRP